MADYDIFRDQLAIRYPSYGHALWVPSPRNPDRPVHVGDVGFIRRGKFYRLFNSLHPADHPSHEELGVPENHEPLVPNVLDHIDNCSLSSNNYCSAGVSVEADTGYHSSSPDVFRQVSFLYQRTRGAAVLCLPVAARREDTLAQGDFGQWMVQHIDSWFAFARKLGLGIQQMEEIVLVTGCDRTRSWTNIAFLGGQVDAQVTFGVNVEGPDTGISFQLSPELVRGAVINQGPEGTDLPENQCVFIRGFRVTRSFWKLPKRLKAAAGPSPDSGGYDRDSDTEVTSIPAITKYRDPLHLLLDLIAEEASDCEIVLAHDDDLAMLSGLGRNTPLEILEPDMIMYLFRMSKIQIHKFMRPCALVDGGSNTDMSLVKVAMLPMTAGNWRRSLGREATTASIHRVLPETQMTPLTSASSRGKVEIGFDRGADRASEPDKLEGDELSTRNQNLLLKKWMTRKLDKSAKGKQTSPSSGGRAGLPVGLIDASSGSGKRLKASEWENDYISEWIRHVDIILQTEDDGDLGISLGGYVKKSDDVTIKVHWLPHPLNSDSSIDVWTFVIKKNATFHALFEEIADTACIRSLSLVLTHNGSRVSTSATPHGLQICAEAQMYASERVTIKYLRAHWKELHGLISDALRYAKSSSDEDGDGVFRLVVWSDLTKDVILKVRPTTTCGDVVKAFLKHAGMTDRYSEGGNIRGEGEPRLVVHGVHMNPDNPISETDLKDGDQVEIEGLQHD